MLFETSAKSKQEEKEIFAFTSPCLHSEARILPLLSNFKKIYQLKYFLLQNNSKTKIMPFCNTRHDINKHYLDTHIPTAVQHTNLAHVFLMYSFQPGFGELGSIFSSNSRPHESPFPRLHVFITKICVHSICVILPEPVVLLTKEETNSNSWYVVRNDSSSLGWET